MYAYRIGLFTLAAAAAMLLSLPQVALGQASITNVTSPLPNGQYGVGNTIPIHVTFSEPVGVTGKPRFQLETGVTDRFARYSTGTGSSTLIFYYIVLDGDVSSDLTYISTQIDLVGGAITTLSDSEPATLTLPAAGGPGSLNFNKDIAVSGLAGQAIDLCDWGKTGPSASGNWVLAANCASVTQTAGATQAPTFFVSDEALSGTVFEGQMVNNQADDDYIGIVWGFQSAETSTLDKTEEGNFDLFQGQFYAFTWKSGAVSEVWAPYANAGYGTGGAMRGARILKVDGGFSEASMWVSSGDDVVPIASDLSAPGHTHVTEQYRFRLSFDSPDMRVEVFRIADNQKLIDISATDPTFTGGKVGFYNYAQTNVTYSAVSATIDPPPLFPTAAQRGQALDVVFTGSGFTPGTVADFGTPDVVVTSMTYLSESVVVAAVQVGPNAILGPRTVNLVTAGEPTPVSVPFQVTSVGGAPLQLTGVNPNQLYPGGTYSVTLTGDNFANDSVVTVSGTGVQVLGYTVQSATQITASIRPAAGTAGSNRTLTVQSAASGSAQLPFAVAGITSLTQTTTIAGASGTATMTGFGFGPQTVVEVSPLVSIDDVRVLSPTSLEFDYTIAQVAACGDLNVSITDGVGQAFGLGMFEVEESDSGPALPPGTTCVARTSAGTTYVGCSSPQASWAAGQQACASWDGALATISSSSIQSLLNAEFLGQRWIGYNDIDSPGTYVWDSGSSSAFTNWCPGEPTGGVGVNCVTTQATASCWDDRPCSESRPYLCEKNAGTLPPEAVVPEIVPNVIGTGATVDVTIRGYTPVCTGSTASFGQGITVNSCTVPNANDLVCNITVASGALAGSRNIAVTSSIAGANLTINQALNIFRVQDAQPSTVTQGGTVNVTITGQGFLPSASVALADGGVTVQSFSFVSGSQINATFVAAANAPLGPYDIFVTNGGGSPAVLPGGLTVTTAAGTTPGPVIAQVSPNKAAPGASLTVSVTGQHFTLGSTVDFGPGVTVLFCFPTTSSQLTCSLAVDSLATLGARDVTVTTPYGSATLQGGFQVSTFTLTQLSPSSVPIGDTADVLLSGFGFVGDMQVSFGAGVQVNALTIDNENTAGVNLTVLASATPGPRDVIITAPGESFTLPAGFNATLESPAVSAVSPVVINRGSTPTVTITGENFTPASTVSFSAGSGGPVTYLNSSTLLVPFTAPATPQFVNVTVTTAAGSSSLQPAHTVYGITSVTPISIPQGGAGVVLVSGVGIAPSDTFSFPAGVQVDAAEAAGGAVSLTVSAAPDAALGPYGVTVAEPVLQVQDSSTLGVTVLPSSPWTPPETPSPAGCTSYTYQFRPYSLCTTPETWADAQAHCATASMDLVTLDSAAEGAFMLGLFGANNLSEAWIGLSEGDPGQYAWADGAPLSGYTNWFAGEPSDALAFMGADGAWRTDSGGTRGFLCEGGLPLVPELVAYYRLDEAAGNQAFDSSGNGLKAQLLTPYQWIPSTLGASLPGNPSTGAALSFKGPTSVAQAAVPYAWTDAITIEAWLNASAAGAANRHIRFALLEAATGDTAWQLEVANALGGALEVATGCASCPAVSETPAHAGGWMHVAATYDGALASDNIKLYVGGTLVATDDAQVGGLGSGPFTFRFGGGVKTTDEVRLWSIALDPSTIQDHAQAGPPDVGIPRPSLSAVTPLSIGVGQSTTLTLAGGNFTTDMTADLGPDITVHDVSIVSANVAELQIEASPGAALGFRTPRVITELGVAGLPETFRVYGVHGVSPSVIQVDAAGQSVEVFGYGLSSADTFDLGPGVSVTAASCTSDRQCTLTVDVASGAALGSRVVTATDAFDSVGMLPGVLTVSGPNVIIWATRADFEASSRADIDVATFEGRVLLDADDGERDCPLTAGPCDDHTWIPGAGDTTVAYGPTGATASGFGGGFLDVPLPGGEFELSVDVSVESISALAVEVFSVGAQQAFLPGQSGEDAPERATLSADEEGNLTLARRVAGVQEFYAWNSSTWHSMRHSDSFPTAFRVGLVADGDGSLRLEVRDSGTDALLGAADDLGVPAAQVALGSVGELQVLGEPQFGTVTYSALQIFDPHRQRADFDAPTLDAGWSATTATGTIQSGAGGGQWLSITHGSHAFASTLLPDTDRYAAQVRAQVAAAPAGSWVPLVSVKDGASPTATPQSIYTVYYDADAGALAVLEALSGTNRWFNGVAWTTTEATLPGASLPTGVWTRFEILRDPSATSLQIYDLDGVLLSSAPLPSASVFSSSRLVVGSSFDAPPGGGSVAGQVLVDFATIRGSMTGPGFRTSGVITIDPFDAGGPINFGSFGLGAALPTGTSIEAQVRTADTLEALWASPFLGPDGTTESVFLGGEALDDAFDGVRFVQWRATFTSTDGAESPQLFDVIIPIAEIPTLSGISPAWAYPGEATTVTLTGSAFDSSSVVDLGPGVQVHSVTVVSAVELLVDISVDEGQPPALRDVVVNTTSGSASLPDGFGVAGLQAVAPASAEQGTAGLAFTLQGIGFTAPATVNFGLGVAVMSLSVDDSGTITGTLDVASSAPLGPRPVSVTSGGFTTSVDDAFTVTPPAACPGCDVLAITAVVPRVLDAVDPNPLLLVGEGFGAIMTIDGGPYLELTQFVISSDSSASVVAQVVGAPPIGTVHTITLTRGAQQATRNVDVLGISGTNHPEIPVGGGAQLTATGAGFNIGIAPQIALSDPTLGTEMVVYDNTSFTMNVTVPAGSPLGTRDLSVQVGAASATYLGALTVVGDTENPLPLLATLSPNVGLRGNAYSVTATGQNFTLDSAFDCGLGITITDVVPQSATQATFTLTIAPGASGGNRTCVVTTQFGVASLPDAFLVLTSPCDGVVCDQPPSPCHFEVGTCDPDTVECIYTQKSVGDPCDDGVACTAGDTCDAEGNCGVPVDVLCNDGIACTIDLCDPITGCSNEPDDPLTCNPDGCPVGGDLNGSGQVNVADVVCAILVTFAFLDSSPMPSCLIGPPDFADMNCDGTVNVADMQILVLFSLQQQLSPAIDRNLNVCHDTCEVPMCGDGICDGEQGGNEDCLLCPEDCGGCEGTCDAPHGGAGCEDADVQECVCDTLVFCCVENQIWGQSCVDEAVSQCILP